MLRRDFFKTLPGLAAFTMTPTLLPTYAHAARLKLTDVRLIRIRLSPEERRVGKDGPSK
jgi:hypothetical protein